MFSSLEMAFALEKTLERGFDVTRISKVAYQIYRDHDLELTPEMDSVLLVLMAMDEGKEFELSELEFLRILEEMKNME